MLLGLNILVRSPHCLLEFANTRRFIFPFAFFLVFFCLFLFFIFFHANCHQSYYGKSYVVVADSYIESFMEDMILDFFRGL